MPDTLDLARDVAYAHEEDEFGRGGEGWEQSVRPCTSRKSAGHPGFQQPESSLTRVIDAEFD